MLTNKNCCNRITNIHTDQMIKNPFSSKVYSTSLFCVYAHVKTVNMLTQQAAQQCLANTLATDEPELNV